MKTIILIQHKESEHHVNHHMKRINYIRSIDPMAYAYLVKALQLLQPKGYFTDSIL